MLLFQKYCYALFCLSYFFPNNKELCKASSNGYLYARNDTGIESADVGRFRPSIDMENDIRKQSGFE